MRTYRISILVPSILPDFYGADYPAARMLDDILANGRPRKTRKATCGVKSIIVRESTQDIRGGGRIVSKAKEFIRLHAQERITVGDVATALSISRRTLENRWANAANNLIRRHDDANRVCTRSIACQISKRTTKEIAPPASGRVTRASPLSMFGVFESNHKAARKTHTGSGLPPR